MAVMVVVVGIVMALVVMMVMGNGVMDISLMTVMGNGVMAVSLMTVIGNGVMAVSLTFRAVSSRILDRRFCPRPPDACTHSRECQNKCQLTAK